MKVLIPFLSAVGLWSSQPEPATFTSEAGLPTKHPAAIQFSNWLSAFNTVDKATLSAYHSNDTFPYSAASRDIASIDRELRLAKGTGGFEIAEIELTLDEPSTVTVVLQEKARGTYARSTMVVDASKAKYPVTAFEIGPIITPIKFIPKDDPRYPIYKKALAPLTPEKRQAVVDEVCTTLLNQYVLPEAGEKIAAALNAHLKDGDYDDIEESQKFAQRLTLDMHGAGHDQHMRVFFNEPMPERSQPDKPGKRLKEMRDMNFGFGTIIIGEDTVSGRQIATLPINAFIPMSPSFASDWEKIRIGVGTSLDSIANTDALLLDLRKCHGGDPETVAFVQSYLLDGPLHTLDLVDSSGHIEQSFSTLAADQLPEGSFRFGATKPIFVLTSNETISGGEDMAYSLQAFKRSASIIGEGNKATAGAANPITKPQWICEETFGKGWWMVAVPNLQPIHAVTGTNWEGVGVRSDIVAGDGEWEGVSDAQEVGRELARRVLKVKTELKRR